MKGALIFWACIVLAVALLPAALLKVLFAAAVGGLAALALLKLCVAGYERCKGVDQAEVKRHH